MLDQVLETICQDPEHRYINFWLKSIAAQGSGQVDKGFERLVEHGILDVSEKCWIWIVKTQTYLTLDDSVVRNVMYRIINFSKATKFQSSGMLSSSVSRMYATCSSLG